MPALHEIAEAFSSHRFDEVGRYLAPDVEWVLVGGTVLTGREAVIQACAGTAAELAGVTTEFPRFISIVGDDSVAVDAVGRYVDADRNVSVVSSCDIYEFTDQMISKITSYAVELEDTRT